MIVFNVFLRKRPSVSGVLCVLLLLLQITALNANNLKIDNKLVADVNGSYLNIKCNISWENSWRNNENWDAAWVFMKVRKDNTSPWQHAYLSVTQSDHNASDQSGNGLTPVIEVGTTNSKGVGVFVHRLTIGTGGNDWELNLRVNYSDLNNISSADLNTLGLDVFGIEMVYVPEGEYYLGDAASLYCFAPPNALGISESDDILNVNSVTGYDFICTNKNYGNAESPVDHGVILGSDWIGEGLGLISAFPAIWKVDFKTGKTIRRFGMCVYVNSGSSYSWGNWEFQGSFDDSNWDILHSSTGWSDVAFNANNSSRSYPVTKSIGIPSDKWNAYRYYRLVFNQAASNVNNYVVLYNIAMSDVASVLPYVKIDEENSIAIGPTGEIGDGGKWLTTNTTLPAEYPKGYQGFYCMKYEMCAEQYVDFLNTLMFTQQTSRTVNSPASQVGTTVFGALGFDLRSGMRILKSGNQSSQMPAIYGLDRDNDGVFYETVNEFGSVACGGVSVEDAKAYMDWAGLRPMTEMEFEKAARGPVLPVGGEYAWGNTTMNAAQTDPDIDTGTNREKYSSSGTNNCSNNLVRNGIFAEANSDRIQAGASYWGIMEMSGNLWEFCVPIITSGYKGNHGDGVLSSSGYASEDSWPVYLGLRGGAAWAGLAAVLAVSDRQYIGWQSLGRGNIGVRAVRTAH